MYLRWGNFEYLYFLGTILKWVNSVFSVRKNYNIKQLILHYYITETCLVRSNAQHYFFQSYTQRWVLEQSVSSWVFLSMWIFTQDEGSRLFKRRKQWWSAMTERDAILQKYIITSFGKNQVHFSFILQLASKMVCSYQGSTF